jgi:hypothetical protein
MMTAAFRGIRKDAQQTGVSLTISEANRVDSTRPMRDVMHRFFASEVA